MIREPVRICITGPESTGKTTIARELADALGVAWVPEAARLYAERVARALTADDVDPIAEEHVLLADQAVARARDSGDRFVIFDTDLVSTATYARHYYGSVSPHLARAARARRAGLYLLCDVDLPWIPDGVRDRPDDRETFMALFRDELLAVEAAWVTVRGGGSERLRAAMSAVSAL